jgi:TM2 domain-containing membrane protein YozV
MSMQKSTVSEYPGQVSTQKKFISKVKVGLLAALFGCIGAHWWYLGRPRAWMVTSIGLVLIVASAFAPVWWENPAFFLLFIPILAGFIEAIVLCLMSDARFDARYNPGLVRTSPSGWGPVLVAGFTLLIGTIALMIGIAVIVIYVWMALGWLDGFDLNSD